MHLTYQMGAKATWFGGHGIDSIGEKSGHLGFVSVPILLFFELVNNAVFINGMSKFK